MLEAYGYNPPVVEPIDQANVLWKYRQPYAMSLIFSVAVSTH